MVYKTTTICNEELIGFYIFIFTLLIGCILAFVHNMSPGKWALNYYICLGENPDKYQISGGKFPVTAFVSMVTIIVYALTNYRFFKAKKKNNRILALAAPLVQSNDHEEQLQISQENFLAQCFPVAKRKFLVDVRSGYLVHCCYHVCDRINSMEFFPEEIVCNGNENNSSWPFLLHSSSIH